MDILQKSLFFVVEQARFELADFRLCLLSRHAIPSTPPALPCGRGIFFVTVSLYSST